ncbi:13255_t:CDS:1, partial [Funneliformis geosporum]
NQITFIFFFLKMSGNTILCKCLVCLNQNISGVIVSFNTFYCHQKNQQEFLDVEETNIIYDKQTMEDIQQDILYIKKKIN